MVEENNPTFPVDFDQCPNCGSTRRVTDEVLKAEQEKGKLKEVTTSHLMLQNAIMAPPSGRFLSAIAITWSMDACMDCGTLYVTHVHTQTVVQGTQQMPQKRQPPQGPLSAN